MEALLVKMVPLALGAALSPTVLTFTILILSAQYYPRVRALAFLAGFVLTVIVIGVVAVGGSAAAAKPRQPSKLSAVLDLALGVLLVAAAVKRLIKAPKPASKDKGKEAKAKSSSLGAKLAEDAGFGIVFAVTDFSSMVFYLAAAKATTDSRLPAPQQIIAMSVVGFGFAAPIVLPLLTTVAVPVTSAKLLHATNQAIKKYGRYIAAAIALLFGVYLLVKGVRGFI